MSFRPPLKGYAGRHFPIDLVYYLVYNIVMIKLNIHEAKTHLSHYLEELKRGEIITICKRNQPIAEIRPIAARPHKQRPVGLAKGKFTVPASFFEELPEETIALFHGEVA